MKVVKIEVRDDEDWDFAGEDTQYLTHGMHPYPAKMIPQIARRLLDRYAHPKDIVLDPFCGSGGVLVEARLAHMSSVGIDINPLACLLARVKSTPFDPRSLKDHWKTLKRRIDDSIRRFKFREMKDEVRVPDLSGTNIEYWFKPHAIKELAIIRDKMEETLSRERAMYDFFAVCFSSTVREVSGTRKGEYKLYRMPISKWRKYRPDVLPIFTKQVNESIRRMEQFYGKSAKSVFSKVFMADTRNIFSEDSPQEARELLLEKPPKIIVTSPPYGDSSTTVAYGQFSRYSSLWLGFERDVVMNVDRVGLGGERLRLESAYNIGSSVLSQTLELIEEKDKSRAEEVAAFFFDLYLCLENMHRALDEKGYCCIVIANRTVRRVQVPTHAIIAEMGIDIGFENDILVYPRRIPSKRLPWRNAPENIPGLKGRTMSKENIIVLKR